MQLVLINRHVSKRLYVSFRVIFWLNGRLTLLAQNESFLRNKAYDAIFLCIGFYEERKLGHQSGRTLVYV